MPETATDFNHNQPVYSINEISGAIKRMLEDNFGVIRLRGEVSGWRGAHSSGHAYFSLKDDKSVINAICWRGVLSKLQHKPEEGLEVIATGRISAYNGKYQVIIEHIEPAGAGALMALLEKRRKELAAEGLFDEQRKQPLPFMPQTIGVVTSPTGAVIRDILHRIEDRFPAHVLVWPVAVQGEGAAEQIAAAIDGFNSPSLPCEPTASHMEHSSRLVPPADGTQKPSLRPDIIIVARGGGSIEDLWPFNEEIVVRAAANSSIPLISAVGHETDTTLIDYVSDKRAPTPTAAAEMTVPVRAELQRSVHDLGTRLRIVASRMFEHNTQRLDDWSQRLQAALPTLLERKQQQLNICIAKLQPRLLFADIKNQQKQIADIQVRVQLSLTNTINRHQEKLRHLSALLESVNYQRVLERGFALVKGTNDDLITTAKDTKNQKEITIQFKDGSMKAAPKS